MNAEEDSLQRVIDKGCWTPVETFGSQDKWHAENETGDGQFDVWFGAEKQGRLEWDIIGSHNRKMH